MSTTDRTRGAVPAAMVSTDGFVELLRPHLVAMTRVARRFAPVDEADDIAQDAMLAAWRYRGGFDPRRGTFRAWLLAIVMAECRRAGGHRWRRGLLLARAAEQARGLDTWHPGPEGGPSNAALERAMGTLSRRQREVIGLHYFVDLPVDEVAAVLGLSTGTVKSTLADARERIRRQLSRGESEAWM